MFSVVMIFVGLFLMAADNLAVAFLGLIVFTWAMDSQGGFNGLKRSMKRKESCHRPK